MKKLLSYVKEHKVSSAIVGVAIVIIIVALVFGLVTLFSNLTYQSKVKQYVKALEDEEQMDKFVEKNVDFRGYYAAEECENPSDFKDEYKKASKDDYNDDDFKDEVKEKFKNHYEIEGKMKVKKIKKVINYDDIMPTAPKDIKCIVFSLEDEDGEEYTGTMMFYKGKVLSGSISKSSY